VSGGPGILSGASLGPITTLPALPVATAILTNDGALGGNPPHMDVTASDGIFIAGETGDCKMKKQKGYFV